MQQNNNQTHPPKWYLYVWFYLLFNIFKYESDFFIIPQKIY
jgi:hypothetical protein